MSSSLKSIVDAGTKLWLDSIDPELIEQSLEWGATGATSNPIIVSQLIETGRFDNQLMEFATDENSDEDIAWLLTDHLVSNAQKAFLPVWESSNANDGYVSFELDPLIEDTENSLPHDQRVSRYIELGKKWSAGHKNRMIKVPATPAGIEALETLAEEGLTLNITLIFSERQYRDSRDAVWRGALKRLKAGHSLETFKSVYSIFVSRVDVYADKKYDLSPTSAGMTGIVNAKHIWAVNDAYWKTNSVALDQEMIFASTGTKNESDLPWKYIAALTGSDIQTNPPQLMEILANSGKNFENKIEELPDTQVLGEIYNKVDFDELEKTLVAEGTEKFATPHKALIKLIADRRKMIQAS